MKKCLQKIPILLLCLISAVIFTSAQDKEAFLTEFNPIQGIPSMKVTCMAIDSLGYIWLGSNLGLHKFDGKQLTTYTHNPSDSTSIQKGRISDIEVAENGDIYFTVNFLGLFKLDATDKVFSKVFVDDRFMFASGSEIDIILCSREKALISHRTYGIFEIDLISAQKKLIVPGHRINQITLNPNDINQLAIAGDSLFSYDIENSDLHLLSPYHCNSVAFDPNGNLYYTSKFDNVLYKYDVDLEKEIVYDPKTGKKFFFGDLFYHQGIIWVASNNGLWQFYPQSEQFIAQYGDKAISNADFINAVSEVMVEENGRIWFMQGSTLKLIDPDNQKFKLLPYSADYFYTNGAQLSRNEYLFTAFYANELHVINTETKSFSKIVNPIDTLNSLFDIARIRDKVWLFYVNGVAILDVDNLIIEPVSFGDFDDYLGASHKKNVCVDENEKIWLGDNNAPFLFRIDPFLLEMDSIEYSVNSKFPSTAFTFHQDEIVLGASKGFYFLDFDTKEKSFYPYVLSEFDADFSNITKILVEGEVVWILTYSEVFKGEISGNRILINKKYENTGDLAFKENIDILRVQSDELIILTDIGILVYLEDGDRFVLFGKEEGFVNVDRNTRMESLGDKVFLLSQGILEWEYDEGILSKEKPEVHIVTFEVSGKSKSEYKNLNLSYEENDLKIVFNAVDLSKPIQVKYRYKLHKEDPWISADYLNTTAYYTDLRPGVYNFQVEAKHKYSEWSDPFSISFQIRPPFWRQWWFILLSILVLASLFYWYFKNRESEIKKISALETRMAELENEALRAQMNPHFIFNSLNSIKSFIIDNDREKAADYLTDFSDLIRTILANSREKSIPLAKELDALKLYMDIENTRLEGKFDYEIKNTSGLDLNQVAIPPLTLQPFIENAIWHGFVHKKGKGQLRIEISKDKESLLVEIEDDGVGRFRSREIEEKHRRKKSFGILITKQRLDHAHSNEGEDKSIHIVDLRSPEGRGSGTKVVLKIRHENYQKLNNVNIT